MNPSLLLHTAARRYCMEQHANWSRVYGKIAQEGRDRNGQHYTDEALATFPRYNVLNAFLSGIELLDPDNLSDMETLRNLLTEIGRSKNNLFTGGTKGEIEKRAINEERDKFSEFIRLFTPSTASSIAPLPYRRILSSQEVKALWEKISHRWKADGSYWYPLAPRSDPSLFAFHTGAFDKNISSEQLREAIRYRDVVRLYELREYGEENYQLALDCWEPYYSGAEGFWVSDALDWIMYASHEGSITTGGWMTDAVLKLWPEVEPGHNISQRVLI